MSFINSRKKECLKQYSKQSNILSSVLLVTFAQAGWFAHTWTHEKNGTTNIKHSNTYLNSQLYIGIKIVVERGFQCVSFSNVYIYSTEF